MYALTDPLNDPGDSYDDEEWDFAENLPEYTDGKYIYLASNPQNAQILMIYRRKVDQLCRNIINDDYTHLPRLQQEMIKTFLGIHCENVYGPNYVTTRSYDQIQSVPELFRSIVDDGLPTSRYLLSEVPQGTKYDGINKPRMRFTHQANYPVGVDGKTRAWYRHIFLDLNQKKYKGKKLDGLIIHELAHTMANHVRYRHDDHHEDFEWSEQYIKDHWPK